MSLRPPLLAPVPEATVRGAHAAVPHGNPSLTLRDPGGPLLQEAPVAALFPLEGPPGLPPWRLALGTSRPVRAPRADRQAAEAVRARIAWTSRRGLALPDPGCDCSVRRACRARLLDGNAEARWLDPLLERGQTPGLLKARGLQRTDSPPVLAASRGRTRLARVAAPRRAARKAVAPVAPDWRHGRAPLAGDERSGTRLEDVRLPRTTADRAAAAQRGGGGLPLAGRRGGCRRAAGGPGLPGPCAPASDVAAPR